MPKNQETSKPLVFHKELTIDCIQLQCIYIYIYYGVSIVSCWNVWYGPFASFSSIWMVAVWHQPWQLARLQDFGNPWTNAEWTNLCWLHLACKRRPTSCSILRSQSWCETAACCRWLKSWLHRMAFEVAHGGCGHRINLIRLPHLY